MQLRLDALLYVSGRRRLHELGMSNDSHDPSMTVILSCHVVKSWGCHEAELTDRIYAAVAQSLRHVAQ
jgi:hypothetical protein